MPQKKRVSASPAKKPAKRVSKKSVQRAVPIIAEKISSPLLTLETTPQDEQQEQSLIMPVPEKKSSVREHHVHLTQAVFISVGFMALFTTFLFISTKMKAQEYSASVSAVVAPTPFNTRPPKQPTWWESVDPYTKLYGGTALAGAMVLGLAVALLLPKKRKPAV